jgi:hypothetical protein
MKTRGLVIRLAVSAALAGAPAAVAAAPQRSEARPSADARLKELEDRQAIHELLMNYGRTLDARDFAGFERLFARDAEYGGARALTKGPAAIRASLEAALAKNAAPAPGRDWHFLMNETVALHGDEATAVSLGVFFVRGAENKLESNSIAIYTDRLVREDGAWKFRRRVLGAAPVTDQAAAAPAQPAAAAPAAAQAGRAATPTVEALAARVKHFEDKEEITNLLIEYGRALDSGDFRRYASLFTRDGSWSGGTGKVSGGPQAIYEFMATNIGGARAGRPPRPIGFGSSYHIMSSFTIAVTGDTATASSRWAFVTAARGPGIQVAGRYEDTLAREDGVWKFKTRQAFNDLPAQAAAAPAK